MLVVVYYTSDGSINPSLGARGGLSGARAEQFKRDSSGQLHELDNCGPVVLAPGEIVIAKTSAGGGYGPPIERDPELVREDVAEGWITRGRANEIYGVVLDAANEVEIEATQALRERMEDR